jgi:hypothetical protein
MNYLEEVSDIFATMHDGSIEECYGTYEELEIRIDCTYLAKYIAPEYEYFCIKLHFVEEFYFEEYSYPFGTSNRLIYDFNELANADIELLYSKVESGRIKVDCTKGILYVKCKSLELFDQQKNPLSPSKLFNISELYWSRK